MELALASAKPSPSPAPAPLLFAPLKPLPLLRFPPRRPRASSSSVGARLRAGRRGLRLLCRAAVGAGEEVFGPRRELAGVQPLVEALPPVARAVVELAVVAAAAAAGYVVGLRAGGTRTTAVAGAAALGAVSVAGAAAVNSAVPGVAAAGLHNYVAGSDDPTKLESSEVEAIASK